MPIDPNAPLPVGSSPAGLSARKESDLERRISALERAALVTAGAGAPPTGSTAPFHVDTVNHRLYVREGSSYRSAGLT